MFLERGLKRLSESGDFRYNHATHDVNGMLSDISDLGQMDQGTLEDIRSALQKNISMSDFLFDIQHIDANLYYLIQQELPDIYYRRNKRM